MDRADCVCLFVLIAHDLSAHMPQQGGGYPIFFLHISSSWVIIRLHTENELPVLSGSIIKVLLGWWGGVVVVQLITLSTPTLVEVELG